MNISFKTICTPLFPRRSGFSLLFWAGLTMASPLHGSNQSVSQMMARHQETITGMSQLLNRGSVLKPVPGNAPGLSRDSSNDSVIKIDAQKLLDDMNALDSLRISHPGFFMRYSQDKDYRSHLAREQIRVGNQLEKGIPRSKARSLKIRLRSIENDLRLLTRIRMLEDLLDIFRDQMAERDLNPPKPSVEGAISPF